MSIDARVTTGAIVESPHDSAKTRHAFRIAGGIALPLLAGEALGWSLPFLGSIFALQLLAVRKPAPTIAMGLGAMAALAIAFLAASWLTHVTLPSPLVFAPVVTLVVFGAFYAQARTQSPFWFMFLIAVCIMPLVANHSEELADGLVRELVGAMACGVAAVWLMHAVFPDAAPEQIAAVTPAVSDAAMRRQAAISTFTIMPLLIFLLWNGSTMAVVMVTALTIIQASAKTSGHRVAGALIAGNLAAGLIAGLAYFLITAIPSFWLLAASVCFIALVLGERIAAANEASPLFVMIASATLILLGTGLTPFMDTSTAFASRVTGVMLGCGYCVAMLAALQAWFGGPSR